MAVGFSPGIYEDSICQDDYYKTLLTIARTVVLSNCFSLEQAVPNPDAVTLAIRHTDATTGAYNDTLIPQLGTAQAGCSVCDSCVSAAWQLMSDAKSVCLCGPKKQTGEEYVLNTITEVTGF
jgi:hypothetical protein